MIGRCVGFVSAVALLAGCASIATPSLQAAWFLTARADAPGDTLYIGLLNQSAAPIVAAEIVLNAPAEPSDAGWRFAGPITLAPGQMLVRPASEFERNGKPFPAACHLPVNVLVVLASDKRTVPAEIRGRVPNFLPAGWERDCGR